MAPLSERLIWNVTVALDKSSVALRGANRGVTVVELVFCHCVVFVHPPGGRGTVNPATPGSSKPPLNFPPRFCLLAPSLLGARILLAEGRPRAPPLTLLQDQAPSRHPLSKLYRLLQDPDSEYRCLGLPRTLPWGLKQLPWGRKSSLLHSPCSFLGATAGPPPSPPALQRVLPGAVPMGLHSRCLPSLFSLHFNRNESSFWKGTFTKN